MLLFPLQYRRVIFAFQFIGCGLIVYLFKYLRRNTEQTKTDHENRFILSQLPIIQWPFKLMLYSNNCPVRSFLISGHWQVYKSGVLACFWTLLFNHCPGLLTERAVLFFHYCTVKGVHSYKQELPNNCFVNVVITECSSTVWGSPWVEQAGPRDGREAESFLINTGGTGHQVMPMCSQQRWYSQVYVYVFVCYA